MSAVLYEPIINPVFKTLGPEFKSSLRELMITLVKEDQEFREILTAIIEDCNVKSKTPNRLAVIETIMGIADFRGISALNGKEEDPTFPEQLSLLTERIDNLTEPVEKSIVPKTVTETRASLLVDHMKRIKPAAESEVFLSHYGIVSFLKHEIQEEYRADKVKGSVAKNMNILQNR